MSSTNTVSRCAATTSCIPLSTGTPGWSYSELLAVVRKETVAAFWTRANTWFNGCGITVQKVLTDNGSCYRSHAFRDALGAIEHRRTRPYRPQTDGKVYQNTKTIDRCDPVGPLRAHRRDYCLRPDNFRGDIERIVTEYPRAHADLAIPGGNPRNHAGCPCGLATVALELPHLVRIIKRSANLTQIPKVGERRRLRDVDDPAHHQSHSFAVVRFQRSIESVEQLLEV